MSTQFPIDSLGDIYERALNDQTDLYEVVTGPNEARGVGTGVRLFFVETDQGESIDRDLVAQRLDSRAVYDPTAPSLLSYERVARMAIDYARHVQEEEDRKTDEFEALTGMTEDRAA